MVTGLVPNDYTIQVDLSGGSLWFEIEVQNQQTSTCALYYAQPNTNEAHLIAPNMRNSMMKRLPAPIAEIKSGAMVGWDFTVALANDQADFRVVVRFHQGDSSMSLTQLDEIVYEAAADPHGFHVWDKVKFN